MTRVAIVGAGPAGAYAAGRLLSLGNGPEVDLLDRLPTPWGLLRGGVAPDHQEIKRLADTFDRQVLQRGGRFLGDVSVGTDVTHADLMRHYTAVIYAVGAQADRSLRIAGEDLPGSLSATAFVSWYNAHPDRRDLRPDLSHPVAVVIGNGNVACDVARILTQDPGRLRHTDIADHALDALRASRVEEVLVLGRRGPAQAAFTSAELRELGELDGVDLRVDAADVELDPVSADWLEREGTFTARKNVELLRELAARPPARDAARRIRLRFLRSPLAIRGPDAVAGVDVARNEIYRGEDCALRARPIDGETEAIDCGLVLRSVGYQAVPLPGVPFDERGLILPNARGRVLDGDTGAVVPGVYATGWIKRGPKGVLGTNKRDAEETVRCLLEDLEAGILPSPPAPERSAVDAFLATRTTPVTTEEWRRIDDHERACGRRQARPRVKAASRAELLEAAGRS